MILKMVTAANLAAFDFYHPRLGKFMPDARQGYWPVSMKMIIVELET